MTAGQIQEFTDAVKVNLIGWGSIGAAQAINQFHLVNEYIQTAGTSVIIVCTAIYSIIKIVKALKKGELNEIPKSNL